MRRASLLLFLLLAPVAWAQTIPAASCNQADVQTALNAVTTSTTLVTIPSGTCSWTAPLDWTVPTGNNNLTIQGQTVVTCSGSGASYTCTATDHTIIEDNYTASANNLFEINAQSGTCGTELRITGLTIEGGTSGSNKFNGMYQFNGPCNNFRLDHNHFNTTTYSFGGSTGGRIFGQMEGVVDHNVFDMGSALGNAIIYSNTIGDTIGYGDGTWANATGFGTSAFMFMENNQVNGGLAEDCDTAGKFVLRYDTILNSNNGSATIHTHGTKTPAGRGRGCRAYEAYHNYINNTSGSDPAVFSSAGGPALIWGNVLAGGYSNFAGFEAPRNDGEETETNNPNGWGYCGTASINPSTGLANGVGSQWDGNSTITTGYPCLDGLGRGEGLEHLNGQNFPTALNSSTGVISWPEEMLEPIYLFGNTIPGITWAFIGDISSQFNRDIYYDCGSGNSSCSSGFTGAFGTGSGLFANRPSTCTPGPGGTYGSSPSGSYGTAYFATDANSGNGELYVCTATNTWAGIYQPYTYPHPLDTGTLFCTNPSQNGPNYSGTYNVPPTVLPLAIGFGGSNCPLYMTLDGSTPTFPATGTTTSYSAQNITTTTTMRVIAGQSGYTNSSVIGGTWTIVGTATAPLGVNATVVE